MMKKMPALASAAALGMLLAAGSVSAAAHQGLVGGSRFGRTINPSSTNSTSSTGTLPGIRNAGGNKSGRLKMIAGTVKSTATSSLILSTNHGDYTVNISSSTKVINRVWHKIVLGNIQAGDKVRAFGRVQESNVDARTVRDISFPVHAGKNASSTPPVATSTASSTNH